LPDRRDAWVAADAIGSEPIRQEPEEECVAVNGRQSLADAAGVCLIGGC